MLWSNACQTLIYPSFIQALIARGANRSANNCNGYSLCHFILQKVICGLVNRLSCLCRCKVLLDLRLQIFLIGVVLCYRCIITLLCIF